MAGEDVIGRWIDAGLAFLTGDPDGARLVPPVPLVERVERLGEPFGVDPFALLAERSAVAGLRAAGTTSCGGATRLLPVSDGWIAVSLPRPEDRELVPAWLGIATSRDGLADHDLWRTVADEVRPMPAASLVATGRPLGLAVSALGEASIGALAGESSSRGAVVGVQVGETAPRPTAGAVVADLSSLWAGPSCARLLAGAGADVITVESTGRPDGARSGVPGFYDLLHEGRPSVALDLDESDGRAMLVALLRQVDVVIESTRPRALRHLGICAEELLDVGPDEPGPRVWISVTGHGRSAADGLATGFGDDAAVAGGLVAVAPDGSPRFLADAIADPLTGLVAANAAADALRAGGRRLLDVSMAHVAASVAGDRRAERSAWSTLPGASAPAPIAPAPVPAARRSGADTDRVLDRLGVG